MKTKKLTIVGYLVGLIILLASIGRWFIIYNDLSQAVLGSSIGIIVLGSSYIYQRLCELSNEIEELNTGIDGLNIWTRNEFEKLSKTKE